MRWYQAEPERRPTGRAKRAFTLSYNYENFLRKEKHENLAC